MAFVDRVSTRDATRLQVDQVYYTPWCDENGKVVDDGTITRLDETTYRWTAAEANLRWFEMNSGGLDVRIEDISEQLAALAVQGPRSRELLERLTGIVGGPPLLPSPAGADRGHRAGRHPHRVHR